MKTDIFSLFQSTYINLFAASKNKASEENSHKEKFLTNKQWIGEAKKKGELASGVRNSLNMVS